MECKKSMEPLLRLLLWKSSWCGVLCKSFCAATTKYDRTSECSWDAPRGRSCLVPGLWSNATMSTRRRSDACASLWLGNYLAAFTFALRHNLNGASGENVQQGAQKRQRLGLSCCRSLDGKTRYCTSWNAPSKLIIEFGGRRRSA